MSEQHRPGSGTPQALRGSVPTILTKISIPRRPRDLLPRPRLVNFIHTHLERKLLLISAPAGYGKTSLLADFAHDVELPVCWYTLDPFDRDLHVFLDHLVAAIALRFPVFGKRSRSFLRQTTDPGSNLYPMVATLVQEIYDTIPEYFFLILDDHHAVEEQEQINEFLDLFVNYVDENCHLILASRTLPALPNLSLLVARGQAAGLSIDELRFTPQEIRDLARQNYEQELSLEQANLLAERTGGWITGLLLTTAAHWEEAHREITVRGRIHVDLYDYLSRQVLDMQPAPLRDFLLASSVLDELSAELCTTVLGVESAAGFMEQLRIRNLFVTQFEGDDARLRYHDLFREFLLTSLRRQSEARFRDLTLRAAGTYAARGEWERAVSRYLALQQVGPVIEIIERAATDLFSAGRWDTLAGWIDALPEAEQMAHPNCLVQRARIHMERGEHEVALTLYEQAEAAFCAQGNDTGRAHAMALRGYVLRFEGRYAEAIAYCHKALALLDGSAAEQRTITALAHKNIGLCLFRLGKLSEGQTALEKALRLHETLGNVYSAASVYHDLGLGAELAGDLEGAAAHYQGALASWQDLGNPGPWANTLNGLGVVYYLQGRYEEALRILNEALDRARQAGDLRVEAFVWASLGDLYRDQGQYVRACQAYGQALEVAERSRVGFVLTYALSALGYTSLLQGDLVQSEKQLRKAMDLAITHGSDYEIGLCHTSLGVWASGSGDLLSAQQHLDRAVELFESGGLKRDLAFAWLQRAQVAFLAGDPTGALADLARSLALVAQLGFDQFVVVEGPRLAGLLHYAQEQGVEDTACLLKRIRARQARLSERQEPAVQVKPQPALKVFALGEARVEMSGESVQWATTQSRDLFFYLLQHRQGLRKEQIGAAFWPEHPPGKLDGIFRSTLYRLRRTLFRESIIFEDGSYCFNREIDFWFDVEAFEDLLQRVEQVAAPDKEIELLEEAVVLYGGDYLDGVYTDWCVLERERLRERHLAAEDLLAGLHAEWGKLNRAVELYQHLVDVDPYREPAHRELMRCYYRLGDRAAAIRQYRSCARILREDLGLSPMPETESLYRRIIG